MVPVKRQVTDILLAGLLFLITLAILTLNL